MKHAVKENANSGTLTAAPDTAKAKPGKHPNSLKAIEAHRFPPGTSGNPGGRRRKFFQGAYEDQLPEPLPDNVRKALGMPPGTRWIDAITRGQMMQALKKTDAAKEIADRTDGKVTQEISGPDGGAIPVEVHAKLKGIMDRLRIRAKGRK